MTTNSNGSASTSAVATPPPPITERWDAAFVYAFICKFAQLRGKVEGLETPMDFEQALLHDGPHTIIEGILCKFISNLRPNSRNVTASQISKHLSGVFEEYLKGAERTVWWDDNIKKNVDPLAGTRGFFALDWDTKLSILRQLVEWQLTHSQYIKSVIDVAWGVRAYKHKKKVEGELTGPPPPDDPNSVENLLLQPFGQDINRKRYWILDDSPRIWVSGNPWKLACSFAVASSTREEFLEVIADLKRHAPPDSDVEKDRRLKFETTHIELLKDLETVQLPKIDLALARIAKSRKKAEQKNILIAQAEIRSTRTRRQARRPDYVYGDFEIDDNDDPDDYKYASEPEEDVWELDDEEFGPRRSSRSTAGVGGRTTRASANPAIEWRGERRSSRRTAIDSVDDRASKRSRMSSSSLPPEADPSSLAISSAPAETKKAGAAAIKPTEVALDSINGKKRSKFWFYAVEPIPGQPVPASVPATSSHDPPGEAVNGNGVGSNGSATAVASSAATTTASDDAEMRSLSSLSDDES